MPFSLLFILYLAIRLPKTFIKFLCEFAVLRFIDGTLFTVIYAKHVLQVYICIKLWWKFWGLLLRRSLIGYRWCKLLGSCRQHIGCFWYQHWCVFIIAFDYLRALSLLEYRCTSLIHLRATLVPLRVIKSSWFVYSGFWWTRFVVIGILWAVLLWDGRHCVWITYNEVAFGWLFGCLRCWLLSLIFEEILWQCGLLFIFWSRLFGVSRSSLRFCFVLCWLFDFSRWTFLFLLNFGFLSYLRRGFGFLRATFFFLLNFGFHHFFGSLRSGFIFLFCLWFGSLISFLRKTLIYLLTLGFGSRLI